MLEALNMDLPKILHGEQKFIYHAPVVVGDVLTFRSEIADVVQKKGGAMTLITVTTKVTNQNVSRPPANGPKNWADMSVNGFQPTPTRAKSNLCSLQGALLIFIEAPGSAAFGSSLFGKTKNGNSR